MLLLRKKSKNFFECRTVVERGLWGCGKNILKKGVDKPKGSEYIGKCAVNER
jgi:hypothetical protein